jgi:hypothetical protein
MSSPWRVPHGIELDRPAVLCAPWFVARKGHVKDIGYPARADHVVVVEGVTATGGVRIDRHVLLRARERTAPCDCDGSKQDTEARVEGIKEREEAREERALVVGEGGEITRLVYLASELVEVGLLIEELDVIPWRCPSASASVTVSSGVWLVLVFLW